MIKIIFVLHAFDCITMAVAKKPASKEGMLREIIDVEDIVHLISRMDTKLNHNDVMNTLEIVNVNRKCSIYKMQKLAAIYYLVSISSAISIEEEHKMFSKVCKTNKIIRDLSLDIGYYVRSSRNYKEFRIKMTEAYSRSVFLCGIANHYLKKVTDYAIDIIAQEFDE